MCAIVVPNVDMKSTETEPSIGQLAQQFELPTHVLRHWETTGLLSPTRTASGHRRYGHADAQRVALILRAKQAGLPLSDIAIVLGDAPQDRRDVLRHQQQRLRERIAAAQASLEMVEHALDCSYDDILSCPRFREYLTVAVPE